MKKIYKEDLWKKIKEELESLSDDITMKQFFNSNVLNFNNLSDSLSFIISKKLISDKISESDLIKDISSAFSDTKIIDAIEEDINEIFIKDPACVYFFQPLLFYKGFYSIQSYRLANFWIEKNWALRFTFNQ